MCKIQRKNNTHIINYDSNCIWERAFYSAVFLFPMFSRTDQGENWLSLEGERGSNEDNVYILFWVWLFFFSFFFFLHFSPATTAKNPIVLPVKVWLLVFSQHRAFNIIVLLGVGEGGRSTVSLNIWPFLYLLRPHIRNNPFKRKRANNKTRRFAFLALNVSFRNLIAEKISSEKQNGSQSCNFSAYAAFMIEFTTFAWGKNFSFFHSSRKSFGMWSGLKIVSIHGNYFTEFHRSAVTQDLFCMLYCQKGEKQQKYKRIIKFF